MESIVGEEIHNLSIKDNRSLIETERSDSINSNPSTFRKASNEFDVRSIYPFIFDTETVEFIRESKVLFAMRGPPGSGKSFTVQLLKQFYPEIAICSSDEFFYTRDGTYQWNMDKLKDAHEFCRLKASKAVLDKLPHIAIDKTNIQLFDVKPFFSLANQCGYIVILVVSQTPWAFDAVQLAKMNTHAVPIERIMLKIDNFEEIIPHYWGWFLNGEDSKYLRILGVKYFNACVQRIQEFSHFLPVLDDGRIHLFDDVYGSTNAACLHCTSVYVGHENLSEAILQYSRCRTVSQNIGRVFRLMATGILFTPRTAGLRVLLTGIQRDLFTGSLESNNDVIQGKFVNSRSKQGSSPKKSSVDITGRDNVLLVHENENAAAAFCSCQPELIEYLQCTKDESTLTRNTGETVECEPVNESQGTNKRDKSTHTQALDENFKPTFTRDVIDKDKSSNVSVTSSPVDTRKAHITLGFSNSSRAVQTGLDLLEVIDCESAKAAVDTITLDNEDSLCYYGEGRCMVIFRHPIYVRALFTGCY